MFVRHAPKGGIDWHYPDNLDYRLFLERKAFGTYAMMIYYRKQNYLFTSPSQSFLYSYFAKLVLKNSASPVYPAWAWVFLHLLFSFQVVNII